MTLDQTLAIIEPVVGSLHHMYGEFNHLLDADSNITGFNTKRVTVKRLITSEAKTHYLFAYRLALMHSDKLRHQRQLLARVHSPMIRTRIKLAESLSAKLMWYEHRSADFPVSKSINDLFGARLILPNTRHYEQELVDYFTQQPDNGIKRGYIRNEGGYHAVHLYMQDSNQQMPWEIQIWDTDDERENITAHNLHEKIKRGEV